MGVRLIVEVLDHWQDAGLTAGERNDLLILAENANDRSRLTWGPVHAPYILKRANKTSVGWKNAVGKLLRKKVLTTHAAGRIGQVAVYHLTPLCPEPPHDGWQGHCTRPERVTSQVTHQDGEGHLSGDPMGHPTGDPLAQEGHLSGVERVTGEVTPTPLVSSFKNPSTTSSSVVAEAESHLSAANGDAGGGGGDHSFSGSTTKAETLVDSLDYRGAPPSRSNRGKLVQAAAAALDDGWGWSEGELKAYLDLGAAPVKSAVGVYLHRLKANELPDLEAWRAARENTVLPGTDTNVAGWMAIARDLGDEPPAKRMRFGHQPYSDNQWTQPADQAAASKVPHCGHEDCDPVTRLKDFRDSNGLVSVQVCGNCHPAMRF